MILLKLIIKGYFIIADFNSIIQISYSYFNNFEADSIFIVTLIEIKIIINFSIFKQLSSLKQFLYADNKNNLTFLHVKFDKMTTIKSLYLKINNRINFKSCDVTNTNATFLYLKDLNIVKFSFVGIKRFKSEYGSIIKAEKFNDIFFNLTEIANCFTYISGGCFYLDKLNSLKIIGNSFNDFLASINGGIIYSNEANIILIEDTNFYNIEDEYLIKFNYDFGVIFAIKNNLIKFKRNLL